MQRAAAETPSYHKQASPLGAPKTDDLCSGRQGVADTIRAKKREAIIQKKRGTLEVEDVDKFEFELSEEEGGGVQLCQR